jgi:hypothetical protein
MLKYEALCNHSEYTITQLTDFLQITNAPQLGKATVGGLPAKANSSFEKDLSTGKILKAAEHKQKELLSETDRKLIAAYLGKEANALGYEIPKIGIIAKLYLRLKYRLLK